MPASLLSLSPALAASFEAVSRQRSRGGAYLCTNSMGVVPRVAIEAERACLELQCQLGIEVWDQGHWLEVLGRYAAVIGRYLQVRPDQVCPVTNITDGLWRALTSIDLRGRAVLHTSMAFTTQLYADHGLERLGAKVITVPSDPAHHLVPTERLVQTILKERPAAVNLSHAAFESSYLQDVTEIAAACRAVDALFVLDAAQTGFVLPLSLEASGADVILLQQHKWGCAGTGAACLVASDRFLERSQPALVGWMSHANPFLFERGAARLATGAWRFVGGTPDVPSKARGAVAAEIIVDQLGIDRVFAHNQALVHHLLEGLRALPKGKKAITAIEVPRRAGFVAIECGSEAHARGIEAALRQRHITLDGRGSRLRVGPTFYNVKEDIDVLVEALAELTA